MNEIFVARELLIAAREIIEARVDVKSRYNHWNQAVFDGKLPDIPVTWGRSKRWGGITRGTINRMEHRGVVHGIEISDFIRDEMAVIDGIMLHEMIHVEMILQGRGGHGWEFDALCRKYSSKSGLDIPKEESIEHFVVPDDMGVKPLGVAVYQAGSRKGLVVYGLKFFENSFSIIKNVAEQYVDYYRRKGEKAEVTLLVSDIKELIKYPEKRSVMRGYYSVPDSLLSEVLNHGQPLAQVAA